MRPAQERTKSNRDARYFMRVDVPESSALRAELGLLGRPPSKSEIINMSRGGLQARTTAPNFASLEGQEILVRFYDAAGSVVPDRTLGLLRRVEPLGDHYLVSVEFAEPLEEIRF